MIQTTDLSFEELDSIARLGADADFKKLLEVLLRTRRTSLESLAVEQDSHRVRHLQGVCESLGRLLELPDEARKALQIRRGKPGS